MIRDLLLDQLCATADNSVEEKGVINFLPKMNAWGGGRHVTDFSLDKLCATSDISVEEKGVRNLLLMEKLRSHVLVSKS